MPKKPSEPSQGQDAARPDEFRLIFPNVVHRTYFQRQFSIIEVLSIIGTIALPDIGGHSAKPTDKYGQTMVKEPEISPIINEVNMLRRLDRFAQEADHPGLDFTRRAREIFELDGFHGGRYCCISASLKRAVSAFYKRNIPMRSCRSSW